MTDTSAAPDDPIPLIQPTDPAAHSGDVVVENVATLKALFPSIVTDGKVDFDVLRQLLGDEIDDGEERYGLNWKGKKRSRAFALTPSLGTLRPVREDSVDWDTTGNIVIEGDNLEVLKLLRKSYAGKVKLIYIDPPYNTGNDFVYLDDYRDSIGSYERQTGQRSMSGVILTSDREARGRLHTEWLNMIYPRLALAWEILADAGVIAISINDIEASKLRMACDEIFGEGNFVAQLVWNNEGNVDQQSKIKGVHEYIVCYSKNAEKLARPSVIDPNIEETSKLYNSTIENSITKNGPANPPSRVTLPAGFPASFASGSVAVRSDKWPRIHDKIIVTNAALTTPAAVESGWSSRNLLELYIANGFQDIIDSEGKSTRFKLTESGAIYMYKDRAQDQGHVLSVIRNVGTTKQNSSMLKQWGLDFSYPKPVLLIEYLVRIFAQGRQDLVLDFFAGSGTTGHAVLRANALDGGSRPYILVQMPARTDAGSLADLTKERMRRAGDQVRSNHPDANVDTGFRVYQLATSNLKPWQPDPDDLEASLIDAVDNVLPGRSEDDLLVELLLKTGIDLTLSCEMRKIAGATVHAFGGGVLIVCLADVTENRVEALGTGVCDWREELDPPRPTTFYFKDSGFENAATKANLAAIIRQRAGNTGVEKLVSI